MDSSDKPKSDPTFMCNCPWIPPSQLPHGRLNIHPKIMTREIVFLNINEPSDALQLAKKPEFRAHVARYQRRQAVKRSTDRIRKKKPAPASADAETQTETETETDVSRRDVVGASASASVLLPASVIPPTIGGLRVDPFQSYPMAFRSWMPLLVDHCKFKHPFYLPGSRVKCSLMRHQT